jgi:protoporphyrinogen oxidase
MAYAPETAVLGGGLAGLAAGAVLTRAGRSAVVVEAGRAVGGLARTIVHQGFRFDLGGHRFLTHDEAVGRFVSDLLGDELLQVPRSSKILLRGRYFDYPLRPANALFGLGILTTLRILADYGKERLANSLCAKEIVSLEDWVVCRFGRAMFDLYFRDYSEKVWGVASDRISAEWVAQRIAGLSLWEAVKNAFSRRSGRDISTLADRFLYPRLGIGRISDALAEEIGARNEVRTGTAVLRVRHDGRSVRSVMVRSDRDVYDLEADSFISSLPLTTLLRSLHPAPPEAVLEAAHRIRFRDLVVVTVMLDRPQVTDLSWLYLPEKHIALGRVHEPRNWSPAMAPEGKTHLVTEYFCFRGDPSWSASDDRLTERTVQQLVALGLIDPREVLGSCVVRVPRAYPLLDTAYRAHHGRIMEYLRTFENLQVIGRGGTFQYLNMDHAIASGMRAAEAILHDRAEDNGNAAADRGWTRMNTGQFVETA